MSVIAVAGGTGHVGRAIVDALNAAGRFTVLVLARESSEAQEQKIGAKIVAVDYSDVSSIIAALETNQVNILISTLPSMESIAPEVALIEAAEKSVTTKRFIPSIWSVPFSESMIELIPLAKRKLDALAALEKTSSLEYSRVYTGYFIDYYVVPHVKSYVPHLPLLIDLESNAAAIPGSGDVPVAFTHTWDVATFIAAYVEKPVWEKDVYIIGDKVTLNEFVTIAEEVKGTKFTVTYDSIEKLRAGQMTELPSHLAAYSVLPKPLFQSFSIAFGIIFEEGVFNLAPPRTLNQEFPEIKARTIREVITAAWKKQSTGV